MLSFRGLWVLMLALLVGFGWNAAPKQVIEDDFEFEIQVKDENGKAVGGATVNLSGPNELNQRISKSAMTTDEGFALFLVPYSGKYTFRVTHPDFETVEKEIPTSSRPNLAAKYEFKLERKAPSDTMTLLEVTVLDNMTGRPVSNATCEVEFFVGAKERVITDLDGKAVLRLKNNKENEPYVSLGSQYRVDVSCSGYDPNSVQITLDRGPGKKYSGTVRLNPSTGTYRFIATVLEKGTRRPAMGVRVAINGGLTGESQVQTTDGNGQAEFRINKKANYTVSVSGDNYFTASDSFSLIGPDVPQVVERTILIATNSVEGMMRLVKVRVRAKMPDGSFSPMKGANVSLSDGHFGTTDAEGYVSFLHAVAGGEMIEATVIPNSDKFKQGKGSVIIGVHGTMANADELSRYKVLVDQYKSQPIYRALHSELFSFWESNSDKWGVDSISIVCESKSSGKPTIEGDVVPQKGHIKVGETNEVVVALLWSTGGEAPLQVKETVELFGPNNEMITNNFSERTLQLQSYSRRTFYIRCENPGNYTVKSTVTGPDGLLWADSATFLVSKNATTTPAKSGSGYYKLVDKKVGKAPPPGVGPYGTLSGSISESNFTAQYKSTPPYDFNGQFNITWSTPPTSIKPGDIVNLTITGQASVTGKDRGNFGASASWGVSGAEVLEGKGFFVGLGGDGKEYTSGTGSFRVKVGSGGTIKFVSGHSGCAWGEGGVWPPCEYTYIWIPNETPPDPQKSQNLGEIKVGNTQEEPADDQKKLTGNFSGNTELKLIGSAMRTEHQVNLSVSAKQGSNALSFSGRVFPIGMDSHGHRISIQGTVYVKSKTIKGTGNYSLDQATWSGLNEKQMQALREKLKQQGWRVNVSIDGTYDEGDGGYWITIRAKSNDPKPNKPGSESVNFSGKAFLKK